MIKNKVTIIIPTFNAQEYILEAIDSVRQQTYVNKEVIIVDDGSTDNTRKILGGYIDKGLIKYFYKENGGQASAMNMGIKSSDGEFVAFLDADDAWIDSNKLQKQVNFLKKNADLGMIGTCEIIVDKRKKKIGTIDYKLTDEEIRSNILRANQFNQSSVVIKRKIFNKLGYYDLNYIPTDYDMWLRIGKKYKFCNLSDRCVIRRVLSSSLSSKRGLRQRLDIFRLVVKNRRNYPGSIFFNIIIAFIAIFLPRSIILLKQRVFKQI